MDLLRDNLRTDLEQRGFRIALPEQKDARFPPLAADERDAIRLAREGDLKGAVFVSEIWRWETEVQRFVRVLVDFKMVRIEDGALLWQRRVQGAIPTPSATNTAQASADAVKGIMREIFE